MPEPPRPRPGRRWTAAVATAAAALLLAGCGGLDAGALAPRGPEAAEAYDNFLISVYVGGAVAVLTLVLLLVAMVRRRRDDEDPLADDRRVPFGAGRFVVYGGVIMPTVVLLGMMVVSFGFLADIDQGGDLKITVTGHQFWWEVYYPDGDVVTANEIHVPTGVPVELTLMSDDVIHSVWVPELAGKQDLVPGRVNRLSFTVDEPGIYRGRCAEYCGLQHAKMQFILVAEEPAAFSDWIAGQAQDAVAVEGEGLDVFLDHSCAGCHTIQGTPADGQLGPDLTHFGSRLTIGAGILDNTVGNLGGWISNSQTLKPGNEMPPIPTLDSEELLVLIDYLRSLE